MYHRTRVLMGGFMEITALEETALYTNAIEAAFQEVARIEALFTVFRPQSPIAQLNAAGKRGRYPLDREILDILSLAMRYAALSGGAYDPSAGPLIDLWGFGTEGGPIRPPSGAEIALKLKSVGFRSLCIDWDTGELLVEKEGMALNFGGVVKGYAIDRAVQVLKSRGVGRGLVSFGSSLFALGRPPGKTGWQIGIQDPRREHGVVETVLLSNRALSTSGDYERCFFYEGKRFSHMLDPRSGYPVSGMAGVSLTAASALESDVLSTATFVLGEGLGRRFLETLPDVEALMFSAPADNKPEAIVASRTDGWRSFSKPASIQRRSFLAMMGVFAVGFFLLPGRTEAMTIRFATEREALERMIPEADHFGVQDIRLSSAQHMAAQELIGKGFHDTSYRFWVAKKGGESVGYAVLLNVIGKKRPITFLVSIDPEGGVIGMEVLVYRESEGSEVRYERFMKQFSGKRSEDPLQLGQDVLPISGATLSSRAATYAARKGLALFEVVYGGGAAH